MAVLGTLLVACSEHELWQGPTHNEVGVAVAPVSISGNSTARSGPTTPVSGGANATGVAVPTGEAVIARITNGLEGTVKQTTGNFSTAISQLSTNLPKVTSVNAAAGYDQLQLLVYAACADLTTGGAPIMQSKYNVSPSGTIAANQAALVSAGIRMLDQHTGGIASQGPDAAQLNTILTNLVTAQAAVNTNTSTMAFITVCLAANTAGIALLGM